MTPFDTTPCALGEGPLWHPRTHTLYWFDILGKKMFAKGQDGALQQWQFDSHHSAAGWVDDTTVLIASETALWRFDTATGDRSKLCALEADDPVTRSNDGRADPWGGFWIGTMGKQTEPGAGAIYRYYRGTLRQLYSGITVSNAICFAPDRSHAYYTDTVTGQVMRQTLKADTGWPDGAPQVHLDLRADRLNPDGAVTDAAGNLWIACWGAARIVCFAPDGTRLRDIDVPARQVTCPAFGGPQLRDLYATSAHVGLDAAAMEKRPLNGQTFVLADVAEGRAEPQVIL